MRGEVPGIHFGWIWEISETLLLGSGDVGLMYSSEADQLQQGGGREDCVAGLFSDLFG